MSSNKPMQKVFEHRDGTRENHGCRVICRGRWILFLSLAVNLKVNGSVRSQMIYTITQKDLEALFGRSRA